MLKYIVEFIGTCILSFVVFKTGNYALIGAALAFSVFFGGAISGGAFNPAIATAMFVKKTLSLTDYVFYVLAEIFGGIVGLRLALLRF